jgi:hypothetical protein
MSNTILFVFEGETIEGQIFKSIESNFFSPSKSKTVIRASFCGEIFQLWNAVKDDDDLDIVEILKERPNSDIKNLERKEVSEVHLFFDHDAHSRPNESPQQYNEKICSLLDTFNNEQERGKLWISYPMAEAIRHCKKDTNVCFKDAQIKIFENKKYPELVGKNSDFSDIKKLNSCDWYYLTAVNIQRTFCLVNDVHKTISAYSDVKEWFEGNAIIVKVIHEKQYEKFINEKDEVVALSPFPLFLLYYFGEPFFNVCRCDNLIKSCSFFCYQ